MIVDISIPGIASIRIGGKSRCNWRVSITKPDSNNSAGRNTNNMTSGPSSKLVSKDKGSQVSAPHPIKIPTMTSNMVCGRRIRRDIPVMNMAIPRSTTKTMMTWSAGIIIFL